MYAYLKGTIQEINSNKVVMEVNGVGYEINVPSSVIDKLKSIEKTVKLHTFLNIREDAQELYGFYDREEKALFEKLISVSGIGPRGALAMLSTLSPPQLALAIVTSDIKTLCLAPGIGKKTAQRMVLELKEKIDQEALIGQDSKFDVMSDGNDSEEALQALLALGYQAVEAKQALNSINDGSQDTAALIRLSLKILDKKR